jgi:hypothetical protein
MPCLFGLIARGKPFLLSIDGTRRLRVFSRSTKQQLNHKNIQPNDQNIMRNRKSKRAVQQALDTCSITLRNFGSKLTREKFDGKIQYLLKTTNKKDEEEHICGT